MTFRVGQKVVCVDTTDTGSALNGRLIEGTIYTVRCVGPTRLGEPGIKIQGYEYSTRPGQVGSITKQPFVDARMRASRFRPVVESKTDISVFTKMLTDTRVPA